MRATLSSKHAEYPFETATVKNYKMEVLGDPHALAKGYDKANVMTVVLKVAKSNYQSEEIQTIIKWSREPYKSPTYYRDLAMHLDVKEDFKKTIVFTHARITVDIHDNTREDDLTITVTAHQKEDKMAGVCFGQGLAETYEKAEARVANPPRLNIYIPSVVAENEDKREYANKNTSYKPVMIKYIAERKNCSARESTKLREGKKYVEICDRNGKVIKLILNSYLYEGRRICLSELFRIGFNGWHEREHVLNAPYERLIDAELALGSIYYGEGIKMAEFRISQSVSTKQWTIKRVSNGEYEKNYTSGINLTEYYCRIMGDAVYRGINRGFRLQHDMGAIYDEAEDAWVEDPEDMNGSAIIDDWLSLYPSPTVSGSGRSVLKHQDANNYDWGMPEELSPNNVPDKGDLPKNSREQILAAGVTPAVNIISNNLYTDSEGRYWVAVGPNFLNSQQRSDQKIDYDKIKFGTKMDIVVVSEDGITYYIPAVLGDLKEHSAPDGLYQTGVPFNKDRITVKGDGSTVEFLGYQILDKWGNYDPEGKNSSVTITNNYKLIEIIIYDGILNY